ncbi:uncharacterized protein LOC142172795 [Nicotiana tabacum]|uniref:Uncharacterized protein LOC142172795 n=1 Tax=Nicotiana tabacum TaxID=4097 RepID=A0AC58T5Y2_TOBAC
MAVDMNVEELLIMGDSDLIIRQAQDEWETRDIKLIPYKQHMEDLRKWFKFVEFRTPDLNLLKYVDAQEAGKIMDEVHSGECGSHMNRYVLAKKILWASYY